MILLFNNRNRGKIMALKSKQDNLPEEFETNEPEQISFEDLEFESEFIDDEAPRPKFLTISGKESWYEPTSERSTIQDLDIGDEFEGRPEITIFENEDKTYDALRLRIMDDGEIVDLYINYPKKDYPYVNGINKGFDFYRKCFDFIFSILRYNDEANVINKNGEEINRFNRVNIENFAKFVDGMNRVGIRITKGNPDSEYNSFIIYKME
jgi:hypothetical protein